MRIEYTPSNYSWISWKVEEGGTTMSGDIDKSDTISEMEMLLDCVYDLYYCSNGFNEQDLVNLLKDRLNLDITLEKEQ